MLSVKNKRVKAKKHGVVGYAPEISFQRSHDIEATAFPVHVSKASVSRTARILTNIPHVTNTYLSIPLNVCIFGATGPKNGPIRNLQQHQHQRLLSRDVKRKYGTQPR